MANYLPFLSALVALLIGLAVGKGIFSEELLEGANGDGLGDAVEDAGAFAGGGADPAGKLGEIVGLV